MKDLQTRVREYLDSKKPKSVAVTEALVIPVTPLTDSEELDKAMDELKDAWGDLIAPVAPFIKIAKYIIYMVLAVVVLYAFSVTGLQNRCYLDAKCSAEMERVNGN